MRIKDPDDEALATVLIRNKRGPPVTNLGTMCLGTGFAAGPVYMGWIALCQAIAPNDIGLMLLNGFVLTFAMFGAVLTCVGLLVAVHFVKGRTWQQIAFAWAGIALACLAWFPLNWIAREWAMAG